MYINQNDKSNMYSVVFVFLNDQLCLCISESWNISVLLAFALFAFGIICTSSNYRFEFLLRVMIY